MKEYKEYKCRLKCNYNFTFLKHTYFYTIIQFVIYGIKIIYNLKPQIRLPLHNWATLF